MPAGACVTIIVDSTLVSVSPTGPYGQQCEFCIAFFAAWIVEDLGTKAFLAKTNNFSTCNFSA